MAERQSRRRKKRDDGQAEKPTDEETAIGKHLRFNLATKSSNFMGHKVEYFTGSKAVDLMLDSKWASGKKNAAILFTDRSSVVLYLERLLQKGMFHRALKVVKKSKKDEKKDKEGKKEEKSEKEAKKGDTKSKKEKGDKKEVKDKSEKEKETPEKEEGTPKAKKSKEGKRKIKLEPTEEQVFRDGNDAYVWIYDPVKPMYYVYGLLLVVGAIAVCLFPLWPPWIRAGTYYVSLGGAGVVGSVLALAIVRFILFVILWSGTMGRIHLWIFPNLLADVGILESFQPAYEYNINKPSSESTKDKTTDEANGEDEELAKGDEARAIEGAGQDAEEAKEVGEDDEEEQNDEEDEEDNEDEENGSGSSSNQDNREEFEIIEPEDISAASEETES